MPEPQTIMETAVALGVSVGAKLQAWNHAYSPDWQDSQDRLAMIPRVAAQIEAIAGDSGGWAGSLEGCWIDTEEHAANMLCELFWNDWPNAESDPYIIAKQSINYARDLHDR